MEKYLECDGETETPVQVSMGLDKSSSLLCLQIWL
jgi:hypothetical protein